MSEELKASIVTWMESQQAINAAHNQINEAQVQINAAQAEINQVLHDSITSLAFDVGVLTERVRRLESWSHN